MCELHFYGLHRREFSLSFVRSTSEFFACRRFFLIYFFPHRWYFSVSLSIPLFYLSHSLSLFFCPSLLPYLSLCVYSFLWLFIFLRTPSYVSLSQCFSSLIRQPGSTGHQLSRRRFDQRSFISAALFYFILKPPFVPFLIKRDNPSLWPITFFHGDNLKP